MNTKSIADAVAARYTGITATNGSATETLVANTASLPNSVDATPVLLVYPPTGSYEIGVSAIRQGEVIFLVRLLRDPTDVPSRTDWLYAWDNAMRDRVEANSDLDLPAYVAEANVTGFRLGIDIWKYAEVPFDLVEHEVTVTLYETGVAVGV